MLLYELKKVSRQTLNKIFSGYLQYESDAVNERMILAGNGLPVSEIKITLKEKPKDCHPKEFNSKMLEALVLEQLTTTTRKLAGHLNVSYITVLRQLKQIKFQWLENGSVTSCL